MTNNSEHPVERRIRPGAGISQRKVMTSDKKQGSVRRAGIFDRRPDIFDRRAMVYDRKTGISGRKC